MASSRPVESYSPPEWARGLKFIPDKRIKFAQLPTPMHKWNLPNVKEGFEVFIKREDLAGAILSGNKIRKLEFMLAEAVDQGCDCIVTCGSFQSNHARVTAAAARQLGIETHLLLLCNEEPEAKDYPLLGNAMLNRLVGSTVYLKQVDIDNTENILELFHDFMIRIKETLRLKNKHAYVIECGGIGVTGLWGYIDAFQELIEQGVLDKVDDIVIPITTGGSALGVAVGNYLNGSKLKIHAVLAANTASYMYYEMNKDLSELGLFDEQGKLVQAESLVDIIEGYAGTYSVSTPEERALLCEVASSTGIVLDTTFTTKGVNGMLKEIEKNPSRFKGRRVLFIHTGGLFGIMNGSLNDTLLATESTNRIYKYSDVIN